MNLRLLRIFARVCQTGNITKAAGELHMTQPAVSQSIKELEAETEMILFDRLGRRIYLTPAGRAYLDKVIPLLEMCAALENGSRDIMRTAPIRVGSCLTIAKHWLPEIHQAFGCSHETPLITTIAGASRILQLLEDNEIDFALYEGPAPNEPFRSHVFSRYQLLPVCAAGHPFAGRRVSLADFLAEPLLLREPGSAVRDVLDSFLRLQGLSAHPVTTSTDSHALIQLYKAGLGIGILPDKILPTAQMQSGLATFEVADMELVNDNRIVFHRDKVLSAAMKDYLLLFTP